MTSTPRRCRRTRAVLPAWAEGDLGRVRGRLVARHVARCAACAAEADQQREVARQLRGLGAVVDEQVAGTPPPPELLDELLARAREPDLRARVAAPARGAVSGARPGLSVALAVVVLALVAGAGWAGWRLARWVAEDRD